MHFITKVFSPGQCIGYIAFILGVTAFLQKNDRRLKGFNAVQGLAYAAHFLRELRAREPSWTLAVARYNAGPDNIQAQKKYVCAVIGNMVRSGLGAWTDNARKFCAPGGA